jgi:hypothetical protein
MPKYLESMAAKYTWTFKARLRARAFGWRGSHPACQRLKEAVTEIKKVARKDPVTAGDGVVSLMERICPAFHLAGEIWRDGNVVGRFQPSLSLQSDPLL